MTKTVLNWDLKPTFVDKAYQFADAISFCYEHKWTSVKGCKYLDYSDTIKQRLQKCFMK